MGVAKLILNDVTQIDVTQDTVSESNMLDGYTAVSANGTYIEGNMQKKAEQTYMPGVNTQIISANQYLEGKQTILGDANLVPENIVSGISIFGVTGTYDVEAQERSIVQSLIEGTFSESIISNNTVSSLRQYAFGGRNITQAIFNNAKSIGSHAFLYCSALTTVSFPACTDLGGYAFQYCSSLTTANFPVCTSIYTYTFYNCIALTTVSFPVCKSINDYAFYNCRSLTTANFPACASISSYAFYSCYALTTASFPSCTTIRNFAFQYCSALTTVSFPACTTVGIQAFQNCIALTSASFPACTSISSSAFAGCSALTAVDFPVCESISTCAFLSCLSLTTVSFPACTTVGIQAFQNCIALTSASFPACQTIGSYAFRYCSSLMSLYLLTSTVPTLALSVFYNTPMSDSTYTGSFGSIFVQESLVNSFKTATNWASYSNRIVAYTHSDVPDSTHITIKVWDNFEEIGDENLCSSIEEYELDASSQSWNDVIQDSPNFGFVFEGYYTDRWDGTYQTYIGITQDSVYAFPLFNDDAYPVLPEDPIVSDGIYWTCLDMSFDI